MKWRAVSSLTLWSAIARGPYHAFSMINCDKVSPTTCPGYFNQDFVLSWSGHGLGTVTRISIKPATHAAWCLCHTWEDGNRCSQLSQKQPKNWGNFSRSVAFFGVAKKASNTLLFDSTSTQRRPEGTRDSPPSGLLRVHSEALTSIISRCTLPKNFNFFNPTGYQL